MTSSDRSSILDARELNTDLKAQIFTFKILVKPWDFVVKRHINIIRNIWELENILFLSDS